MENEWIIVARQTIAGYRNLIDQTIQQLNDEELRARPSPDANSVATILRHLGGNLKSRWTDFMTSDGEKPDRDRDREFQDWDGDRESLMEYFDDGWKALGNAIDTMSDENLGKTILIRGEEHSIPQALTRSITHLSYHAGQIALIARLVHSGEWNWLTVAPGKSQEFNRKTWGTSASRSVFGSGDKGPKTAEQEFE